MNKEDFRILKELCGLHQKTEEVEKSIQEERSRISKVENLRSDANKSISENSLLLESTSKDLLSVENSIEKLAARIQQGEQALSNASSEKQLKSSEAQLISFKEELQILEEEAFKLMETSEELESEISEKNTFLEGSEKTLIDITSEVQNNIQPMNAEKIVLLDRIQKLKAQLPSLTSSKIEKLIQKDLIHGPLTKIVDGSCFICRSEVNAIDKDKIEKLLTLIACSNCSRLFIPNSTLY